MGSEQTRTVLLGPENAKLRTDETSASVASAHKSSYGYEFSRRGGDTKQSSLSLIAADLKDMDLLLERMEKSLFDFSLPTLIVSECVLVYMEKSAVAALSEGLATKFNQANGSCLWLSYDMINPSDSFGRMMCRNLAERGIRVPGITDFPTLAHQKARFSDSGWDMETESIDMLTAFATLISGQERARVQRLEIFDEVEEWEMIMQHYCLTLGAIKRDEVGGSTGELVRLNASIREGLEKEKEEEEEKKEAGAHCAPGSVSAFRLGGGRGLGPTNFSA